MNSYDSHSKKEKEEPQGLENDEEFQQDPSSQEQDLSSCSMSSSTTTTAGNNKSERSTELDLFKELLNAHKLEITTQLERERAEIRQEFEHLLKKEDNEDDSISQTREDGQIATFSTKRSKKKKNNVR